MKLVPVAESLLRHQDYGARPPIDGVAIVTLKRFHDDGGWWIEEVVKGDTANKVLEYMEYDVADLHPALARDCERAVRDGRMSVAESQAIKRFYEGELNGYAYLE